MGSLFQRSVTRAFTGPSKSDTALAAMVEVQLEEARIEMVGGPTTSTHYSLPRRVTVTFPPLPASFGGRIRLLHELNIVFEGKAEYWDSDGRYTPLRLHSMTVPLVSHCFSIQPFCPEFGAITIDLPFDLRIPGWLPPTHLSRHAVTTYGVVASAKIGWANETVYSTLGTVSPLCLASGEMALARVSKSAYRPIAITRHRIPTAMTDDLEVPHHQHAFRSKWLPVELTIKHADYVDLTDPRGIKIDMHLRAKFSGEPEGSETPEDDDDDVPLSRAMASSTSEPSPSGSASSNAPLAEIASMPMDVDSDEFSADPFKWVGSARKNEVVAHVVHLAMEIEEKEDVRSTVTHSFSSQYPLPAEQPGISGEVLLGPSRAPPNERPLFPEMVEPSRRRTTRPCLLLPNGVPQSHVFARPRAINATTKRIKGALTFNECGGRFPQPDVSGPFVRITHSLKTHVTFQLTNGHVVTDTFKTPIRLLTSPASRAGTAPPPYVTVFHENGQLRDCDPLPLYSAAEDIDMAEVEHLTTAPTPQAAYSESPRETPEPEPSLAVGGTPSVLPSTSRVGRGDDEGSGTPPPRSRSTAADLSPTSRKLFEQWAREQSASLEGEP